MTIPEVLLLKEVAFQLLKEGKIDAVQFAVINEFIRELIKQKKELPNA